jgi:hypothetical protein
MPSPMHQNLEVGATWRPGWRAVRWCRWSCLGVTRTIRDCFATEQVLHGLEVPW